MSDLQAFTIFKANSGMTVAIDPIASDVISGSGSLRINRGGTTGQRANLARASSPTGFTSGRARFRIKTLGVGSLNDVWGLTFQMSQADMTTVGTQTAYFMGIQYQANGSFGNLVINRLSTGLANPTQLALGAQFALVADQRMTLEATWILDLQNLGGIRLFLKRGVLADYSDLVVEPKNGGGTMDLVSTTTVLQTSVAEGPAVQFAFDTSPGDYLMKIDSVIPLIVGG